MKAIPLHVALAAAFFALAGSATLLAPAGAQDYRSKQGAVPCDCSCGAEHCPKPKPKPMKEITLKRGTTLSPHPRPGDAYKAAPR